MDMKKIAVVAIVLVLLTGGTVLASSKENSPVHYLLSVVQVLEEKLTLLEEKLDDVQTTPGPQGEQGEQGEPGPQGVQGVQGESGQMGSSLMVVDATGLEVGYLVDHQDTKIFVSSLNKIISYDFKTASFALDYIFGFRDFYYTSADCSGQPLIEYILLLNPYHVLRFYGVGDTLYSPNDFTDIFPLETIVVNSQSSSSGCTSRSSELVGYTKLYPVELPSYTAPLSIVVE